MVAVVTGAGSGIGRAVSLSLLEENAKVFLVGRKKKNLIETKQIGLDKGYSGKSFTFKSDVSSHNDVTKLFNEVSNCSNRLDLLFNNAGVSIKSNSIDKIDYKDWKNVINTNINGMFLCAKYAYSLMKKQKPKGGRIINNGSISAFSPRPGSAPYTTSKHAISGLTKAISLDGRKENIVCSQIDIGNAYTKLTSKFKKGTKQPNGTYLAEPVIDVKDVAKTVMHMIKLPLNTNILNITIMANNMPFIGRG